MIVAYRYLSECRSRMLFVVGLLKQCCCVHVDACAASMACEYPRDPQGVLSAFLTCEALCLRRVMHAPGSHSSVFSPHL
eukprot:4077871-Pleurochrysis_carterae.AAC.2